MSEAINNFAFLLAGFLLYDIVKSVLRLTRVPTDTEVAHVNIKTFRENNPGVDVLCGTTATGFRLQAVNPHGQLLASATADDLFDCVERLINNYDQYKAAPPERY